MENKSSTQDIYQRALKRLSNAAMFTMLRRALQCCPPSVFQAIQKGVPSQIAYDCVQMAIALVWEPASGRTLASRHAPAGNPHTAPACGSGTVNNSFGEFHDVGDSRMGSSTLPVANCCHLASPYSPSPYIMLSRRHKWDLLTDQR